MLEIVILIFFILIIFFPINKEIFFNLPYKAICALAIFMLLSNSIYYSNVPRLILKRIFKKHSHLNINKFMLIYSFFIFVLSFFLTNDIALFIALPFIKYLNFPKEILEILGFFFIWSANIGACASPVGSPQNIFVWSHINVSFLKFMFYLMPLFISMLIAFFISIYIYKTELNQKHYLQISPLDGIYINKKLFTLAVILLFLNIIFFNTNYFFYIAFISFLVLILFYPSLLKNFDYKFILLFIFLSWDINILKNNSKLIYFINKINSPYFSTAFLSQIISNFPACLLISKLSGKYIETLYGANVACNGVIYASIANLIGIQILNLDKIKFMKRSFFAFILSLPLGYLGLKILKIL